MFDYSIKKKKKSSVKYIDLAIEIIENSFEQFSKKHFEKLMNKYSINEEQLKEVITLISKLNPKPGGSYAGGGKPIEQVIPDFKIVLKIMNLILISTIEIVLFLIFQEIMMKC